MRQARYIQTTISLNKETHARIKDESDQLQISFSERLRDLLELGFIQLDSNENNDHDKNNLQRESVL